MTQLLASVTNAQEALMVLQAGMDIIDLKDPAAGALGALPLPVISGIVAAINHRAVTSATVGDLPMQPGLLLEAIEKTAATGVDIIKVGFFANGDRQACIEAIKSAVTGDSRIVAVLFADEEPDFELLPQLQQAGFYGVMLDTSLKNGLGLMHYIPAEVMQQFVSRARKHKLKSGLAGSLRLTQFADVIALGPDYLGFRGALCSGRRRESALDETKVLELKRLLRESNTMPSNLIEA
jgi:uncharacterized protein (UPF0264 family)